MVKNTVQFRLLNVYVALANFDADGNVKYDTPFKISGAVSLTLDPNGSTSPFYADDSVYYSAVANQGYTGSLEMAMYTDKFRTEVLGDTIDANGVLVENMRTSPRKVALLYEVEGDKKAARRVLYNVQFERGSDSASTTTETKTPQTATMNITVTPLPENGVIKAYTTAEVDPEVYANWFKKVYMPSDNAVSAKLSSINLETAVLEPAFSSEITEYTARTENTSNTINAVPENVESDVNVSVNGQAVQNGSSLIWDDGENSVIITVSNGGSQKIYTITVIKTERSE